MKVVLRRVGLTQSVSLIRGSQIRFVVISPRVAMIELLILNLKRGEMSINQKRDKLVVCVIKNMRVNVLFARVYIW